MMKNIFGINLLKYICPPINWQAWVSCVLSGLGGVPEGQNDLKPWNLFLDWNENVLLITDKRCIAAEDIVKADE